VFCIVSKRTEYGLGKRRWPSERLGWKFSIQTLWKNMLAPGTSCCLYRRREKKFILHFSQEVRPVYCNNLPELVRRPGLSEYDPREWRLSISASSRSIKGVLLHNWNVFGSAPGALSVLFKESYGNLGTLLLWTKYQEHNWQVCGDFKILSMSLGQRSGYARHPNFMCEWDDTARSRHWIQKDRPPRENWSSVRKILRTQVPSLLLS
jgi:hypothetical protein